MSRAIKSSRSAFVLLGACSLVSACAAAPKTNSTPESNPATPISELSDVGWVCPGVNSGTIDLNDKHFHIKYEYLKERMFQLGISENLVACELGEPTLHQVIEKPLRVVGFNVIAGESLMVYGNDINRGAKNKNALIVIVDGKRFTRQLMWLKTEDQSVTGIRLNFETLKYEIIDGKYNVELDDVFKTI